MAGFKVDTDSVRGLGRMLSGLCADLVSAVAPSDLSDNAAGSHEVADALTQFHSHWHAEQGQILDNITALAKAVHDAADAYDKSDASVAGATGGEG